MMATRHATMTTAKRPAVALTLALAALAATREGRAQELAAPASPAARPAVARLEVVRRGAAERDCPGAAALATLVDTVANRPAIARAPDEGDVSVAVVLEPVGAGFRATLEARGARTGERVLEDATDATCRALAEAIAVTTVLLLDARAGAPGDAEAVDVGAELAPRIPVPIPPSPSSPPAPPPPGAAAAAAWGRRADAGPEAPAEEGASVALGAATAWSIDAAVLAGATVTGGGVELGAWGRRRVGPGSIGIGARLVTPSEHEFANGAVEVWSARGALEGCLELRVGDRLSLAPCGTAVLGAMIAHGQGFDRVDAAVLPTLALGGAALAALGIGDGTAVLARLGVAASPVRPAFQVEDDGDAAAGEFGEAYRAPAVAAEAGVGVRLAFD